MGVKSSLAKAIGLLPQGEAPKEELAEVQAARKCIAEVVAARDAHAIVVGQKDASHRELNEVLEARAAAQARLSDREKEIALTGAPLPDKPLPEDAQIILLDRHIRIKKEKVRASEEAVRKSQENIDGRIRATEEAWKAAGAAFSERLLGEFRSAALVLRESHLGYRSLAHHFARSWDASAWKCFDNNLAVKDPMTWEWIMNPAHAGRYKDPAHAEFFARNWPASANQLIQGVDALRAEIDAVRSK